MPAAPATNGISTISIAADAHTLVPVRVVVLFAALVPTQSMLPAESCNTKSSVDIKATLFVRLAGAVPAPTPLVAVEPNATIHLSVIGLLTAGENVV